MTKPIGIPRLSRSLLSPALGALFVLCWSSGFLAAKLGAADAATPTLLMWRFVPLALALLPVLILARRSGWRPEPSEWRRQLAIGALSQSGYLATVYWAISLGVSTGTTALIDGTQPLVVAALVGPLLGAATSGRQWLGLVIGLAGVALVTGADAAAAVATSWWAYLVPFAGMLCLVAATFLERRSSSRPSALRILAIHCTGSAVVFTVAAVLTGTVAPPASVSFWVATAILVVFATFGGYGLYWVLLRRIGVTRVNALLFLVPPVTALSGAWLFGEPFTVVTAAGLVLALAATALVSTRSRRERTATPTAVSAGRDA